MNNCKICKSALLDEKLLMRVKQFPVNGEPQPDIYTYEAWCPVCEIYLTKNNEGKAPGEWKLPDIDPKATVTTIDESQYEILKLEIVNLLSGDKFEELIKKNGTRFLSLKKKEDVVLQFLEVIGERHLVGYAIKRRGFIIGKFVNFNQFKII